MEAGNRHRRRKQRGGQQQQQPGGQNTPTAAPAATKEPWALRPLDWPVPVLPAAELQTSSPGVALVPAPEAPALLQRLQGSTAAVAVVTLRSLPNSPLLAAESSVPLQRGPNLLPAKVWVYSCGPTPVAPKLTPKQVGPTSADPSTTQLVVEVDERYFPSSWSELQQSGARGLLRLLRGRAARRTDILDVFALAYRGELQGSRAVRAVVRVVPAAVEKMLASSGEGGLFFRSLFLPETAEVERAKHGVVWLDLPLAEALEKAKGVPWACGLVRNARGLGVRVVAAQLEAAYAALKGKQKPTPKALYEVSGVPLAVGPEHMEKVLAEMGWSGRALRTFVRRGARVWVVEADTPPAADVWTVDSALVTVQPAQPRRATPAQWSRTPPKEPQVQMGPPAPRPSPAVPKLPAQLSGEHASFAAAVSSGLRSALPHQKDKVPKAPAEASNNELESPLPTGGTNTPRRSPTHRPAPTPATQQPTGLPGLETLVRQLVEQALATERQKLQEERAQLERERKELAKQKKALRSAGAPQAKQVSPAAQPPTGAAVPTTSSVAAAAPTAPVAIRPSPWADERAELLNRIATLEDMLGRWSASLERKAAPLPSGSASSTPNKPRKKKPAGAVEAVSAGAGEAMEDDSPPPDPRLPIPRPSPQGSPDVRAHMDNDD